MQKTRFDRAGFIGSWAMDRQIDDRRAGQAGVFAGTATFEAQGGDCATYQEAGTLRIGTGSAFQAVRSYHWQFTPAGIVVRFADGRDFLTFDPAMGGGAVHHCDPDHYSVAHDFSGWPQGWLATWTVTGPRKDYTMQSRYTRDLGV